MSQPLNQPIIILSRRKPHLILLLILSILTGVSVVLNGAPEERLPDWIEYLWGGALFFSGGITLLAHLQRWDREKGMGVERGALTLQSAAVITYGLMLPAYLGWTAETALSLLATVSWAWANLWEVKLITADLKLLATMHQLKRKGRYAADE